MAQPGGSASSGVAMHMCLLLGGKFPAKEEEERGGGDGELAREGNKSIVFVGPTEAPHTWWEEMEAAAAVVRFIWSELLGKWPIMDLAFGVKYLMRQRGNLQVASVYTGSGCVQLKGPEIMAELVHMLRLMNLCMFFSKKPFREFLKSAGYSQEDVLLRVSKAGILKPAFTIICDKSSNCFLLVIRGMHSIKDVLTALNATVVPFRHSFLDEDGLDKTVLGYAHCGMVAAAHWIANCATPCLLKAFSKYSDYNIKIVGNSLGGGTAALLTHILREREEFSSSTCIAFAPAACMTWDLAESGKDFITTIINGSDQVPSCSITSINYLRSEVSSSSWLSNLWARFSCLVNCFTAPLGNDLESISSVAAEEGAGATLHYVSSKTRVLTKRAQVASLDEGKPNHCTMSEKDKVSLVVEKIDPGISVNRLDFCCSSSSDHDKSGGEMLIKIYRVTAVSTTEARTEGELRFKLVKELHERAEGGIKVPAIVEETRNEENAVRHKVTQNMQPSSSDAMETLQFYPPGKILHMIETPAYDSGRNAIGNQSISIYKTPRGLYSKIHLSKRMIKDHYMPMYKKTMELLIDRLGKD